MTLEEKIKAHAQREMPRESCGLIVVVKGRRRYIECTNIAPLGDFAIDPVDYARCEDLGTIVTVVHSHVNQSPTPSQADLIGCEKSGLEWLIVCANNGDMYRFKPSGFTLALVGREFNHGTTDCYSLIRDYYKQKLDIELPDYDRADNWWLGGDDLYMKNIDDAGFYLVNEMQEHDMIYMRVASPVPNHGAIYIGDGKIMHHQHGRLSSIDMYGGWYQKITTHILRHKDA